MTTYGEAKADAQLARAADAARNAVSERNALIIEARAAGRSLRDLAAVTGLSHTAIAKIAKR